MAFLNRNQLTVWVRVQKRYPADEPVAREILGREPSDYHHAQLTARERFVKVVIDFPPGYFDPVADEVRLVASEIGGTKPQGVDSNADKHVAFPD